MEFRGTKGKWILREFKEGQMSVRNMEDTRKICVSRINNSQESTANLLLISKAPEMLEMLQKCLCEFLDYSTTLSQVELAEDINKIIKEATEL